MSHLLEVKNIETYYDLVYAVRGASLSVEEGSITAILGNNGAGKSTTMKMLTGFLRPDAGRATVDGIDVTEDPVAVKSKLGYLPESAPAYPEMTVAEFLGFIAEVRGFRAKDAAKAEEKAAADAEAAEEELRTIKNLIVPKRVLF